IIQHLRDTLDMDQGQIPANLESIYVYCLRQLRQSRFEKDPAVIEHVSSLLGQLREAFASISAQ
ncbi:MAG: flagellar export chaperone FliS, partial [Solirubrobacteraceae bacterium]